MYLRVKTFYDIDYLKHLPEGHPDVVNAEGKLKCMLSTVPRHFKIMMILASLSIMHVLCYEHESAITF